MRSATVAGLVVAAVVAVLALVAAPAFGGGSRLDPVKDQYEPGQQATLVGYTGGGQLGWIDDGPFYAYLVTNPATHEGSDTWPVIAPDDLPLARLELEETGAGGYLALRASITFTVPDELADGAYEVAYCNDPCTTGLGDLIGGTIWVGVTPDHPIAREWALDDPEIANLDGDALVSGPGFEVTAGEIRAGAAAVPDVMVGGPAAAPAIGDARPATPADGDPRRPAAGTDGVGAATLKQPADAGFGLWPWMAGVAAMASLAGLFVARHRHGSGLDDAVDGRKAASRDAPRTPTTV